jgi:Flp pilus assembly protein CpaB
VTSTVVPQTTARMRRIDLRVLVGLVLLLAGVLGTLTVIQQAGQRTPVLVMARSVQAGQVIGPDDVRVAELGTAPGVATVGVEQRARVVGRRAAVPLEQGQVLGPAVLADGPALEAGQVAMSLAVAAEHAAAGQLRAGDQVAVVASGNPEQPSGGVGSGVLLSPVRVLSVLPQGDSGGGGEGKLLVSLAVRPSQAGLLARAAQGTIDLVLLPAGGS